MKRVSRAVTIEILKQAFSDFGRDMRDFVRQEIGASEVRIKKDVTEKMSELKTEIIEGVTDVFNNGIHPQLDNHERRLLKLETKTQH